MKSSVCFLLKSCLFCLAAIVLVGLTSGCGKMASPDLASKTTPSQGDASGENGKDQDDRQSTGNFCKNDSAEEEELSEKAEEAGQCSNSGKGHCISVCVDGEDFFIKEQQACALLGSGSTVTEGGCI